MTSGGRAPGAPPAPAGSFTTRRGSGPSSVTSRCQWCLGEAPERRKSTQKKEMGAAAAAAMPRLRCSPRGPALVRREESSALVLLTRSRAGLWFLSFFDSFLSLAATRPEISHRTRTALGELLPKGRGDTRATPRKKKIQRGRIQHGYLGTASVFQQAKAYAAFYRLLARHTEGEKAQVFLLLIYGSHLIKV